MTELREVTQGQQRCALSFKIKRQVLESFIIYYEKRLGRDARRVRT